MNNELSLVLPLFLMKKQPEIRFTVSVFQPNIL